MKNINISKLENKIIDFFVEKKDFIFFIVVSFLGLYVRYYLLAYESYDYTMFLHPWFQEILDGGGLKYLPYYSGDYNMPYVTIMALLSYIPFKDLYLIKMVSIVFDYLLAMLLGLIVYKYTKKTHLAIIIYSVILFLPSVLLNGALWGQCDSLYCFFTILSLYFLVEDKYTPSFIFLGLAFSFKLQTVFILPIYIIKYVLERKFSILNFLIIPIVNLVLCIPSMIMGKSIIDCFTAFFIQVNENSGISTLNYPNIYYLLSPEDSGYVREIGILTTVLLCGLVLYVLLIKKHEFNTEFTFRLTIFLLLIITYCLPHMHERYLFVGEVLSILYYVLYRKIYMSQFLLI